MVTAAATGGTWPPPWLSAPSMAAPSSTENRPSEPKATEVDSFKPFGDEGFSFLDLIDVVNPLQHLPVIGPLYRSLTGDTLGPLPRIAGSTLFFGPVGAGISIANVVVEQSTGKDVGGHVLAWFDDESLPTTTSDEFKTSIVTTGNDPRIAEDPVSAWARQELAHRVAEAKRRNLIASATMPVQAQIAENRYPAHTSRLQPQQTITNPQAPDATAVLSALGVRDVTAAIYTMETQKDFIVDGERTAGKLQQAALAYNTKALDQQTHVEPTRPSRENPAARKLTSEKPAEPGAVGRDGGWFSTSMLGALKKYHAGETTNPLAIGSQISGAY